jgi:hypothetical protein
MKSVCFPVNILLFIYVQNVLLNRCFIETLGGHNASSNSKDWKNDKNRFKVFFSRKTLSYGTRILFETENLHSNE